MKKIKKPIIQTLSFITILASFAIQSKEFVYYEPHTGYIEKFDTSNVPDKFKPKTPFNVIRAGNITWNITYQDEIDNTGLGFDDATFGASRRAVVDATVNYVNNVLNTTPGTPPTIDVHWDLSTNLPADSTLASMGTFHANAAIGFDNGVAFSHITTGIDPSGAIVDITGQVNFGRVWNSELDSTMAGEFDLATVILHEITHGLGFAGLADSAGSFGTFLHYSEYEDFLVVGQPMTLDLFPAGGGTFSGTAADLISDDVFFIGPNATAANGTATVKIYAPSPYNSGSSISHLDTPTFSATEVMVHAIGTGSEKRAYGVIDLGVLQDLGYTSAAPAGMVPVELMNYEVE